MSETLAVSLRGVSCCVSRRVPSRRSGPAAQSAGEKQHSSRDVSAHSTRHPRSGQMIATAAPSDEIAAWFDVPPFHAFVAARTSRRSCADATVGLKTCKKSGKLTGEDLARGGLRPVTVFQPIARSGVFIVVVSYHSASGLPLAELRVFASLNQQAQPKDRGPVAETAVGSSPHVRELKGGA